MQADSKPFPDIKFVDVKEIKKKVKIGDAVFGLYSEVNKKRGVFNKVKRRDVFGTVIDVFDAGVLLDENCDGERVLLLYTDITLWMPKTDEP